jgi:hypothetical protein
MDDRSLENWFERFHREHKDDPEYLRAQLEIEHGEWLASEARIAELIALIPHNDVWGDYLADDAEVEQCTKDNVHSANPKPFGNWGKGLNPDPCKRCRAALEDTDA